MFKIYTFHKQCIKPKKLNFPHPHSKNIIVIHFTYIYNKLQRYILFNYKCIEGNYYYEEEFKDNGFKIRHGFS